MEQGNQRTPLNTYKQRNKLNENQTPLFIHVTTEKKEGKSKVMVMGTDMKLLINAIKQVTALSNSAAV